ncbi:hypothetical protein BKA70DRAFT_1437516 [Coprinopsis sp. MPI-PUGE-AT-0042]|nr:hypothetical protein BKA70DRAFT_1437516 [Coprinopsis sp. MPI-PUGE-AT-0042]
MAAIDNSPTYLAIKDGNLDKLGQVMSGALEDEWYDVGDAIAVAAELDPANTTDHLRLFKSPKLPEWELYRELRDSIQKLWYINYEQPDPETTMISPQNHYLIGCLLSGCARQEELCYGPDLAGEIAPGLQHPAAFGSWTDPRFYELNAIGSCITILAAGAKVFGDKIFKDYIYSRQQFTDAIGCLNTIQNPIGLRFFEVVKEFEKNGWEPALSSQEIWEMFSPEALNL